jgi:ketosteroid isomerase-like protein
MDVADILRLEDERYAAVLAKDVDALQRLLHTDLVYMHSNGVADSKSSYVDGVRDGLWDYKRVERADQAVKIHDGFALVFNRLVIDIVVKGVERHLNNRALAVWAPEGSSWRLIAMQSGPIPGTKS